MRFATRVTWWGAKTSLNLAGEVLGLVTGKHDGDGDGRSERPEPAAWRGPAASSTSAPGDATSAPSAPGTGTGTGRTSAQRPARVNGSSATVTESGDAQAEPHGADRPGDRPIESQGQEEVVDAEPLIDDPDLRPVAAVDYDAPPVEEPAHVSEELELVEEVSEPGAQDGAGAQIRIAEPWEGYRTMKAADIVERIGSASAAELAAIELYEAMGRKRKSVLTAAERALRRANPPR